MVYYEEGSGPPVVVLHGNSMSSKSMQKIVLACSKSHKVYAIDSRGHGKSELPLNSYSYDDLANDVIAFIKIKKLVNVILVGYSDGGNVAWRVASQNENIKKIVLISPNYDVLGLKDPILKTFVIFGWLLRIFRNVPWLKKGRYQNMLILNDSVAESKERLKKIKCQTLLMYAQRDVIKKNHIYEFKKSLHLSNSRLSFVKRTNHINIIFCKKTILILLDFINDSGIINLKVG